MSLYPNATQLLLDEHVHEYALPAVDTLYKLLLVGKPYHDGDIGAYRILCHFQPWLVVQNRPASEKVLSYAINSTFARDLICGTIWEHSKGQHIASYSLPTDYHSFSTSPGILHACRLKHLLSAEALSPPEFWMAHDDTWVICVNSGSKKVIIPYFELLRTLFYKTSRRLTDYIFSQNAISSLCSPLVFPNKQNFFTGRYRVAAERCTSAEARLLGCLLFDPQLIYLFNASQAYWRTAASKNNSGPSNTENTLVVGDIGASSFIANGHNFSHNSEEYFWVYNLEVTHYQYKFDTLLYYPLKINQANKLGKTEQLIDKGIDMPECPDILHFTEQRSARFEIQRCLPEPVARRNTYGVSYSASDAEWVNAIRKNGLLPTVVRMLPWAKVSSRPPDYHSLSEDTPTNYEQRLNSFTSTPRRIEGFRQLILEFKSQNFEIKYIRLNNPKQVFGAKASVFPVGRYSPLPLYVYNGQIRRFHLVEISLSNALLYLAQPYPETNPKLVLLFIKQSLTRPTTSEWNMLLSSITPVKDSDDLKTFYSRILHAQTKEASSNTALLVIPVPSNAVTVEFCVNFTNHVLDRFRKRLQFFIAVSLRYPKGITPAQNSKITALSRSACRTPNWNWRKTIHQLWLAEYCNKRKIRLPSKASRNPWKNTDS